MLLNVERLAVPRCIHFVTGMKAPCGRPADYRLSYDRAGAPGATDDRDYCAEHARQVVEKAMGAE